MIYAFLATGFEEVEALAVVDVCRRAGLDVNMVSIMDELTVTGAHGIKVVADSMFADNDYSEADLLFLPGGMPGAANLDAHAGLRSAIMNQFNSGKPLSAICAAPFVYGNLGILNGKKATCYPGFEAKLTGATATGNLVEKDGQFMTGKGPGAALALGYMIVEHFCGKDVADSLRQGMIYNG
ncbi:MAG: DJ-1/PfpI family protein [Bacteroidaceae bacterium]|jgi:4-methyl-5(b-hydroxyethyl)-thiazole monophosphate biosynthesis|nr:DJ-1/PfpI family protein [Bacteroidaceae bacterium]